MQELYLVYFISFLGLLICFAGLRLIRTSPIYKKGTKETQGVIESYLALSNNIYNPKISFKAGDKKIVFISSYSSNSKPVVGKSVRVVYNPQIPENAEIKSMLSLLLPAFITVLGFCITAACIIFKIIPFLKATI